MTGWIQRATIRTVRRNFDNRIPERPGGKHRVSMLLPALALSIAVISGCTWNHHLKITPPLDDLPQAAKEPLTAGVYYSPEFRTYSHARLYAMHRYIVPVGEDSVALFDRILPMVFQKVVHLDGLPPFGGIAKDVDVIIEPNIEAFNFRLGFDKPTEKHRISYRLTLYTKEGVPLASRIIIGREQPPQSYFYPWKHMDKDMRDAAMKILEELRVQSVAYRSKQSTPASANTAIDSSVLVVSAATITNPFPITKELSLPLADAGIIGVAVMVKNSSGRKLLVRDAGFRLVLPGGRTLAPAGPGVIPARLEKRSYKGDIAGGFLGLAIAQSESTENTRAQGVLDDALTAKQFGEKTLQKDETAEGIVFFMPADGTPSFSNADLSIWFIDPEMKSGIRTSTPVAKLNFTSPSDKK